jgi:lipopolysaccharide/colanic/teichoic acid biosynthesis glycosyltransferase
MYRCLKRTIDLVVGAVALVILAPVLVGIGVALRLGGRGPALFRQERAGRHGRPFILYKFRTMRPDADPFGPSPKSGADPRLTRFGRFLREYSLDELPQFVNILRGDMSLIGPRPLYRSQIPEWDERQRTRLLVKPGLTGLAQISGRGELTREDKLELDALYVERAGIWLDCRILLATIAQVLGRKGVYERRYSRTEHARGRDDSGRKTVQP